MRRYFFLLAVLLIFGCGGGSSSAGGGSDSTGGATGTAPGSGTGATQPTKAVLTLATQGAAEGTAISGIGITVSLPPGTYVATDSGGAVADGVIAGSGKASPATLTAVSSYVPATGNVPGSLRIVLASTDAAGFGVGEYAKVTCGILAGSHPGATDFHISDFVAVDLRGGALSGVTPTFTVQIQ